jgi:hypothetical protein
LYYFLVELPIVIRKGAFGPIYKAIVPSSMVAAMKVLSTIELSKGRKNFKTRYAMENILELVLSRYIELSSFYNLLSIIDSEYVYLIQCWIVLHKQSVSISYN